MLNLQRFALPVKRMTATGLLVLAGETIRELRAVVGQQFGDLERCGLMHAAQKIHCTAFRLIGIDAHEHPACGAVYGHKQVAVLGLIRHLGQEFDVDVHKARLIVLEGLPGRFLTFHPGLQIRQFGQAFPTQQAADPRAGGIGIDELFGHSHQVIQGQQTQAADLHDDELLGGAQCGVQLMGFV